MGITTKNGDGGMTSLVKINNVPKSDERIQLLGAIDELTCHLGLIKAQTSGCKAKEMLTGIQNALMTAMAGIADPHNGTYRMEDKEVRKLEGEMERLQGLFTMQENWSLPGGNLQSAEIDVTRAVARRAERHLSGVTIKYGSDKTLKQYMNRLSDYLFLLARYAEHIALREEEHGNAKEMVITQEQIMKEVLKRVQQGSKMTLETAKQLIGRVETYAEQQGLKSVIAVCNSEGNPVAVHVMDGAYLVSFEVAVKKAYTAAAVKMSTKELGELSRPGGTFQGLEKLEEGKLVLFGGGVPLFSEGRMIGALGVSGGTGEEDHGIAVYGAEVLNEILS